MKPLFINAVAAFFLSYTRLASPIESADAVKHIGESTTVSGKVAQVTEKNGNVYINFDAPYLKQTFYAFVPASRAGSIGQIVALQGLEGKVVKIADYKGEAAKLSNRSQPDR